MLQLSPKKDFPQILFILTLFAVIGPISIDLCTPSLPAIAQHFGAEPQLVQWCIGAYMVGFSASMLICGSLADRYGRKKTLAVGYLACIIATALILLIDNIYVLIISRFFQALFGCFGTALARTIARDYYEDVTELRMLSYISACMMIAPLLAPIVGGIIQEYWDWQYNFLLMLVIEVITLAFLTLLPESYTPIKGKLVIFRNYLTILSDKRYLRFAIAAGSAFSVVFVFIVGAPFVFIDQKGFSPIAYAGVFALVIASYMFSVFLLPKLNERYNKLKCIRIGIVVMILGFCVSTIAALVTKGDSVWGYVLGVMIYELGLGLYIPTCQLIATMHIKTLVGTATSLVFFIEMTLVAVTLTLTSFVTAPGTIALIILPAIMLGVSISCRTYCE